MLLVGFMLPMGVSAQSQAKKGNCPEDAIILEVEIPGATKTCTKYIIQQKGANIVESPEDVYYITDISQFIRGLYNFFIGAIALAAIVVLMIGGFQYVIAAGNQSKIGEAKETINGAITGLILTLLSYTLLNAINPKIVSLEYTKPTSVDAIQRGLFCADVPGAYVGKSLSVPEVKFSTDAKGPYTTRGESTACGKEYFIEGSDGETTCIGKACESGKPICFGGQCVDGHVYGSIDFDSGAHIDNDLKIMYLCSYSLLGHEWMKIDLPTPAQQLAGGYVFEKGSKDVSTLCGGRDVYFYLQAEVNDQVLGTGIDDWYALDRTCKKALVDKEGITDPVGGVLSKHLVFKDIDRANLITKDEITKGFRCDINLTRTNFPAR